MKTYKALCDIRFPADPESWRKAVARKYDEVEWTSLKEGENLEPYNHELERSLLASKFVEEVKGVKAND